MERMFFHNQFYEEFCKVVAPDGTISGSVDPTAPWYRDNNVLDKNQLPNPYNGNDIEPDDGATTLVEGRPWV